MIKFIDLKNQQNLIAGVILHALAVNRDERGILVEVLKSTWDDVYHPVKLPRAQSYYSITHPGFARDEDVWHYHPKQSDRFAVARGDALFALYDWRKDSSTYETLNLFSIGEKNGNDQYLLLIPSNVLHSFSAVGDKDCLLLGIPTHLYDSSEEGRIGFSEVLLPDGSPFRWDTIRNYLSQETT